jgi:hypothetical protein
MSRSASYGFHICTNLEMRPHVIDEWGYNDTFEYCVSCSRRYFLNRRAPYQDKSETRKQFQGSI